MKTRLKLLITTLALVCAAAPAQAQAQAHGPSTLSDLSAASTLPIAVSVMAPVALISAGASLSVIAVESASAGTVWVLERASDGVRASVTLSGQVAGGLSVAAGTVVLVSAVSAGWVLSAAGRAVAFVPNELGKALLHNERITR